MMFPRSLVPVALMTLSVAGASACKDDPPAPTAETPASASAVGKARLPTHPPTPMAKVDPQSMKEYRLDVCYFGALTLRQARDAYLGSLGKDEPSEKKIPTFSVPVAPPAAGSATPAAGAGAKPTTAPSSKPAATPKTSEGPKLAASPAASGTPSAKPATAPPAKSGAPAAGTAVAKMGTDGAPKTAMPEIRPDARRPFDMGMRPQHDRNARACKVASDLKEPAMPEVDAALAEFAPFAIELAKDIGVTSLYYQREEYKNDKFEKGKEYHKKLVASFAKLDELLEKIGSATAAWRKEHPADPAKMDEGEKLTAAAFDDGREIVLGLLGKKVDVAAHKERVAKFEKSTEALKTYGASNAADVWSKAIAPSLDAFARTLKDAEAKVTDKGVAPDAYLNIVSGFSAIIEAKYRALTRALIAKGQTIEMPVGRPSPTLMVRPQPSERIHPGPGAAASGAPAAPAPAPAPHPE